MSDEKPMAVERLMRGMDRCAVARGEALWTNGYRCRGRGDRNTAEGERLYEKEQGQWKVADQTEKAFRRLVQRLVRHDTPKKRRSRKP